MTASQSLTYDAEAARHCRELGSHDFPSDTAAEQVKGTTEVCRRCGTTRYVSLAGTRVKYGKNLPAMPPWPPS